jgi:hypothetical protein
MHIQVCFNPGRDKEVKNPESLYFAELKLVKGQKMVMSK